MYTAKGLASIFAGPVAAMASVKTGSWVSVFWVMIACDGIAALMALFWLKPVAARTIAAAAKLGIEHGGLVPVTQPAPVAKGKEVEKVGA